MVIKVKQVLILLTITSCALVTSCKMNSNLSKCKLERDAYRSGSSLMYQSQIAEMMHDKKILIPKLGGRDNATIKVDGWEILIRYMKPQDIGTEWSAMNHIFDDRLKIAVNYAFLMLMHRPAVGRDMFNGLCSSSDELASFERFDKYKKGDMLTPKFIHRAGIAYHQLKVSVN